MHALRRHACMTTRRNRLLIKWRLDLGIPAAAQPTLIMHAIKMAIRVDADTAVGMLSDIETEPESEDSLYGNLDSSEDSVSSREECDEPENDENSESDDNDANLDDSSDESSDEEPEDTTATRSKAAGSGRGRGTRCRRGRGAGRYTHECYITKSEYLDHVVLGRNTSHREASTCRGMVI